ncbi:MAG TPA: hypothetical protein VEJ88_06745 [Dissulfurispiraceae bacterium]|nr:hypothetical protein [Dissulfurispiraceae bacterium]
MSDFKYKDYTPEEGLIYNDAMVKIRKGMENGLSFSEAFSMVEVKDTELKHFIEDDALKVLIAEMHFEKAIPLPQVADALKVSLKTLNIAVTEMLEDIGTTAAGIYRQENPEGPIGHA